MSKEERQLLEKKNWKNSFELVGEVKLGNDTFKIDEHSKDSDFIYNRMNLMVNCGEKHGMIFCECFGGYGANRDNVISVHGKTEDGRDDYKQKFTIAFDDRKDKEVLETIGNGCFKRVQLEKADDGKLFTQRFVHNYDFVKYCKEHLTDGMPVRVRGDIKYNIYKDKDGNTAVSVKREIRSIALADSNAAHQAKFTQTMLIGKDAITDIDKSTGRATIDGIVLEYVGRDYSGRSVNKIVPIHKDFFFDFPKGSPENAKKINNILFDVRKGYDEITFDGEFIETGSTITLTEDDIDDDIKALIDAGLYSMDEVLNAQAAGSGNVVRKMVLTRAARRVSTEEDRVVATIDKISGRYSENDVLAAFQDFNVVEDTDQPVITDTEEDNDLDFLDSLGL